MINVTVYQRKGAYIGARAIGHSGYAEAGEDIICAAVSALVINTLNSIETFTGDSFQESVDEEQALIDFLVTDEMSAECGLLIRSLVLGLSKIAEQQEEYITLSYKEV